MTGKIVRHCVALLLISSTPLSANSSAPLAGHAIGAQYDTTHIYVAPEMVDPLVSSLVATFGGTAGKKGVFQVTPTASQTVSQVVLTPVGPFSIFGFKTPVPYPFGSERTGYLVDDLDTAVAAARDAGGVRVVAPFADPIGRDAVIRWPGGVHMQLYWHTTQPSYPALARVPENRVYLSNDDADAFINAWRRFAKARVVEDDRNADAVDIGRPGARFRRVRLISGFGKIAVLVSDGHLAWPYGREVTGYEVADLNVTLARATGSGAHVLVGPYEVDTRRAAIVEFPGGYIAEVHAGEPRTAG